MNRFPVENIDKVESASNADLANKSNQLVTSRTIELTGDIAGSASFNGTADANITATIKDNSHNHTIANIDNLQTTLDAKGVKLTVSGKTLNLVDSNDNVLSTVTTQDTDTTYTAATAIPLVAGTATVGTSVKYAREDHVHPAQTTATSATSATKATQDESGNNIKASYVASMSISDGIITYKNKNNTSLGTIDIRTTSSSADKLTTSRTITIPASVLKASTSASCQFDGSSNATFGCSGCSSCSGTCTGTCTSCQGTCSGCSNCSSCGDHTGR